MMVSKVGAESGRVIARRRQAAAVQLRQRYERILAARMLDADFPRLLIRLAAECAELASGRGASTSVKLLSAVGALAGVLAIVAIATGSLTALSLLALGIVVLWAGATLRHAWLAAGHRPLAT